MNITLEEKNYEDRCIIRMKKGLTGFSYKDKYSQLKSETNIWQFIAVLVILVLILAYFFIILFLLKERRFTIIFCWIMIGLLSIFLFYIFL
jgi:hypothetical protein